MPFLDYPIELRKLINNRGPLPGKDSAMKLIYLRLRNISSGTGGYSSAGTQNRTVVFNTLTSCPVLEHDS